jgi:hypothetical protein
VLMSQIPFGAPIPFSDFRFPKLRSIERGDLVGLRPLDTAADSPIFEGFASIVRTLSFGVIKLGDDRWTNDLVIRRVLALPGEELYFLDGIAYIKPVDSDSFLAESDLLDVDLSGISFPLNWPNNAPFPLNTSVFSLGTEEYFVIAENRSFISDSRLWGTILEEKINSLVLFKFWPPSL